MLLMQEPRLLLLDEPVAGMTDEETMRSAELFLALAGEYTLVVVEHDMDFVAKHRRSRDRAARGPRAGRRLDAPGAAARAGDRSVPGALNAVEPVACAHLRDGCGQADADDPQRQPVLQRQPYPARRELRRARRPVHGAARPQRRRQDDAAEMHHRAVADQVGHDRVRRPVDRGPAAVRAREARHRLRAAGTRDLSAAHRRRESRDGTRDAEARAPMCRASSSRCFRC